MAKTHALDKSKVLRPYEGVVILDPDTPEDQQKALFRKNKDIVESFAGKVAHVETWGKRQLANPVKKRRRALYFYSVFEAQPQAISELERTMAINDRVLRFMHTRLKDDTNPMKHLEEFHNGLKESINRERERENKVAAKRKFEKSM